MVDTVFLSFTKFIILKAYFFVSSPYRVLKAMEGKWITDQLVSCKKYLNTITCT